MCAPKPEKCFCGGITDLKIQKIEQIFLHIHDLKYKSNSFNIEYEY